MNEAAHVVIRCALGGLPGAVEIDHAGGMARAVESPRARAVRLGRPLGAVARDR